MTAMSSAAPKASTPTVRITLRQTQPADYEQIINLNNVEAPKIEPLTRGELETILAEASYVRVADLDGEILAVVISYHSSDQFESGPVRWFRDRHDDFFFIDRVLVSEPRRLMGLGRALYQDLAEYCQRQACELMACNVSVRPRNEDALAFHKKQGFKAVGEDAGEGTVSIMLTAPVPGAN